MSADPVSEGSGAEASELGLLEEFRSYARALFRLIAVLLSAVILIVLFRFVQYGVTVPRLVQLGVCLIALAAVTAPGKLHERLRAGVAIGGLFIVVSMGLAQSGLASPEVPILISAPLLVAVIFGRRAAHWVLIAELVVVACVASGYAVGLFSVPVSAAHYSSELPNWVFLMLSVAMMGGAQILVIAGLREHWSATAQELARTRDEAERQPRIDSLTGVANRAGLIARLEARLEAGEAARDWASIEERRLALVFIDLDRFKTINDRLGHAAGDELLRRVALRLRGLVSSQTHVARLAGDEFTLLFEGPGARDAALDTAQAILEMMRRPLELGSDRLYMSASIGLALYPEDETSVDGLLGAADRAMYQAKARGGAQIVAFSADIGRRERERSALIAEIPAGIERGEFRLHYQPILDLASGAVVKAEALVRWQHPRHGLILPGQFLPVAEQAMMVERIDDWVLSQVSRDLAQLRAGFGAGFAVSLNVSPLRLLAPESAARAAWCAQLVDCVAAGNEIVLEITESALLSLDEAAAECLKALRAAGLRLALDDFGAGYSSLIYFLRHEFDYIKIDRALTAALPDPARAGAIIEALVGLTERLGCQVIAEGIETPAQLAALRAMGCGLGQGFYFARPMSLEALLASAGEGAGRGVKASL